MLFVGFSCTVLWPVLNFPVLSRPACLKSKSGLVSVRAMTYRVSCQSVLVPCCTNACFACGMLYLVPPVWLAMSTLNDKYGQSVCLMDSSFKGI